MAFLLCVLIVGSGTTWATEKTETWSFGNSSVTNWTCTNQSTYCGCYYSGKNSACVVQNKSISNFSSVDFSAVTSPSVTIYVTGITNSGTNSYTVSLVDKDGNTIGTSQTKSNGLANTSNSSSASESYVTLTPVKGATGYRISLQAKGALTGTRYVLTYTEDSRTAIATLGNSLNVSSLNTGNSGKFSTTITPADPGMTEDTDYIVTWSCSPAEGLLTSDDGSYSATARGAYTVTATVTPDDDENYREVSKEYTVNVSAPVVVAADDVEMTYGDDPEAISFVASDSYAGTLTYASGNTSIATVDASGNVTAVAAGTTTITISAPADAEHLYTAGEDVVINVTVNAPAGGTATPASGAAVELYSRLATGGSGLPSGWTADASDLWHYESSYGAVAGSSTSGNGTKDTSYDLVTEDFDLSGYNKPFVYFSHVGNTISTSKSTVCKLFVQEGDNTPVQLTIPTWFNGSNWSFVNSGNIDLSAYTEKTVHFIFRYTPSGSNANGKWEVKNFIIKAYNYPTENITVAASGFSTHCYQYPLDLDKLDANVKAYIVTNVSGSNVTFKQITGTIKGGVPFILYGTAAVHTLTTANSSTIPANNMLVGTLSPTYITATNGDYTNFGLKGGKFVKASNGVIGANKAYLPILTSALTESHEFNIVFEENGATGICDVRTQKFDARGDFYNLNGQKVQNPTKGMYIVNGRKVIIK